MKTTGLIAPVLMSGLIFVFVWAVGMMVVRSSALATESSLELLRLQIEVTRLHQALAAQSRETLAKDLGDLQARAGEWSAVLEEGPDDPATSTRENSP